ncbi:PaaX family transcriptional regulator C-terminal domain-containing protein [Nocardioides jiangxiensis]|uniref:PaaX family transcriptional regulator C-terminal domain-containing protein n=1 Tax=Nocardioides jiangxiensis TaxID=3064524 RepID=A0ABT9AZU9_9ACTN|nr:PaaX family transcriptional regulator C-terminal domain-containing protein [Nocardioides sp. WY-20]MDO7868122.1 PaaX family transcriptional regulator C-terminal domain-containing protein [Nocardioides sp. WY-20]
MSSVPVDATPLSARSVVLSLLLGAHPARLTTAELTRAGDHFGVASATLRVALSRAVAAGDLVRFDGGYQLGDRLISRQARQDEGVEDAEADWDGSWEMAVVVVTGRSGAERAALRDELAHARLAELREGVWTRPANLRRPAAYAADPVLETFRATPHEDPAELAARLWDLPAWATTGRRILEHLHATTAPADRLAAAAHLVRHLSSDPLLPAELLPADWPGADLRRTYAAYQAELHDLARNGS